MKIPHSLQSIQSPAVLESPRSGRQSEGEKPDQDPGEIFWMVHLEIYGKYMENIWKIYGKYMENIENIIWWVASTGDSL